MKKIVLIILLLILPLAVLTQPVYSGSITFTTQAQLDSFQVNYPNCTEVEGSVTIEGDDITNLYGLSNLNSVWSLYINKSNNLYDLSGLDNLTFIESALIINYNSNLVNLSGLNSLTSIAKFLRISGNPALTSLAGLENLKSCGTLFRIYDNEALEDISSLENMDAGAIEDLSIHGNTSLSDCGIQNLCEYLTNPTGSVNIFNNATGCNNPSEIAGNCGFTIPCLPYGNYIFTSQSEIDSFQENYPGCNALEGGVKIYGEDITNLDGLSELTSVTGSISISNTKFLTSLTGLNNLSAIGGSLIISVNDGLTSLSGLENLTTISGDLSVYDNNALTSFAGLEKVTSIGGDLRITANDELYAFSGLENLKAVGGEFIVEKNNALISFTGLDNVTTIGGDIYITSNGALESLNGLDNVTPVSNILVIGGNYSLSTCEVQYICDILAMPGGTIEIFDNAAGCKDKGEVEAACDALSTAEILKEMDIRISPNPFTDKTTFSYILYEPSEVTVCIYNFQGQLIEKTEQKQLQGEQQVQWNAEGLPSGIYYYRIQAGDIFGSGKVVKN